MGVLLACLAPWGGSAAAQLVTRVESGGVTGEVRERGTGAGVGFALVIVPDRDLRAFANATGRFHLAGLGAGVHRVEVRQIGFAPTSFSLRVLGAGVEPAPAPLVLELVRQALVLPEVTVSARECRDPRRQQRSPAEQAILDLALTNSERLGTLEREYPLAARFERLTAHVDAADSALAFRWDTLHSQSQRGEVYRRGRVVEVPRFGPTAIRYFTTSDVARREFLEYHCFWVAGREMLDTISVIRIEFAPSDRVRTADWEGALLLDATTGLLRQSEASLSRVPRNAGFTGTRCTVTYTEVAPALVHEATAECRTDLVGGTAVTRRETWRLIDWAFVGRRPGG